MKGICKSEGCDRPIRARGMCQSCYRRAWADEKRDQLREQNREYYRQNAERVKERTRAYKAANPEQHRASNRAWREANKERSKEVNKAWVEANKEQFRAQQTAWRIANRERLAEERRARRQEDGDRHRAEAAAWRAANPELIRSYKARYRALQMGAKVSAADYREILERSGMVCHICKQPIESRADLHFDHVIPLSKLGPHEPDNIRPAHKFCNLSKGDRVA